MSPERICIEGDDDRFLLRQHIARYEFAARFARDQRVIDIACGTGYGSALLAKASAREVIGIDISSEAIEVARERHGAAGATFVQGSTEILSQYGEAGLVVSFETIEHIEQSDQFLTAIAGVIA